MDQEPSHFGFDDDRSLSAKIGRMFLLLLMAGFLLMFTALAFGLPGNLWWKIPAHIAIEICWTFWLLAMVVNWWMPRRLRRLFRHAEKRMVRLMTLLRSLLIGVFVLAGIAAIVWIVVVHVVPRFAGR